MRIKGVDILISVVYVVTYQCHIVKLNALGVAIQNIQYDNRHIALVFSIVDRPDLSKAP